MQLAVLRLLPVGWMDGGCWRASRSVSLNGMQFHYNWISLPTSSFHSPREPLPSTAFSLVWMQCTCLPRGFFRTPAMKGSFNDGKYDLDLMAKQSQQFKSQNCYRPQRIKDVRDLFHPTPPPAFLARIIAVTWRSEEASFHFYVL